jgi:hypothetical protein
MCIPTDGTRVVLVGCVGDQGRTVIGHERNHGPSKVRPMTCEGAKSQRGESFTCGQFDRDSDRCAATSSARTTKYSPTVRTPTTTTQGQPGQVGRSVQSSRCVEAGHLSRSCSSLNRTRSSRLGAYAARCVLLATRSWAPVYECTALEDPA